MNLLNIIVRTHFVYINYKKIYHFIQTDIGAWGRSTINPNKSKFYFLELIVVQGYTARVLTLFYTIIRRRGYFIDASDIFLERSKNFNTIIGAFSHVTYLQLVDNIRRTTFTLNVWKDLDSKSKSIKDIEFRSIYRIL